VTAVFAYGFDVFFRVQDPSDLAVHLSLVQQIRSLADLKSFFAIVQALRMPHFLYELLLIVTHSAGISYPIAADVVLGLCYGLMALLIVRELERRGARFPSIRTVAIVPCILIASHIFLPTILKPNLYYGYFVPIAYHNPTQQLNKVFALWIYFAYCASFIEAERVAPSRAAAIGGLSILSAIAKPSFLIAFLPSAALFAAVDAIRRRWDRVMLFGMAIVVPAALVLLWQARMAYAGSTAQSSIIFAPFVVFDFKETLYKFPASMAFPLVVWFAAWCSGIRDARLAFLWVFCAVALFETLLLGEGGGRLMQGNFAWSGQTAVFLAYVEAALLLVTRPELTRWQKPSWAIFGVHVACGLAWYGAMFFPQRPAWL
jgi:hypothetical protein